MCRGRMEEVAGPIALFCRELGGRSSRRRPFWRLREGQMAMMSRSSSRPAKSSMLRV